MKIGGLQRVTLIDYPKKVAAIIFTAQCNMRCPFCYNSQLVVPEKIDLKKLYSEEFIWDFLTRRRKYLDGIVITGGEPLLQSDLMEFCQKLKQLGYLIKLDTNGLLPDKLSELLHQNLIDYVAMDIKGPLDNYQKFCGIEADSNSILKTIKIIADSGINFEFRSTIAKDFHSVDDILAMVKILPPGAKYFLQNFSRQQTILDNQFTGQAFTTSELEKIKEIIAAQGIDCEIR